MKVQPRDGRNHKAVKAGKGAKRRIDLSGCKLVGPYGRDPQSFESLSAMTTKAGKVGLRSASGARKRREVAAKPRKSDK